MAVAIDVDVGLWTFNAVDIKFKSEKKCILHDVRPFSSDGIRKFMTFAIRNSPLRKEFI